jgi:uncharacterized membrane protein YphA (DoxX/SURF4 family)
VALTLGPRSRRIALWALKILVGLVFAAAGAAKLAGVPMLVQEFDVIGLGQWFRFFTGAVEITSAVLLLAPRTSLFGALGLLGVCVGALFAQATVLHGDLVHVFVLMAATAALAWTSRPRASAKPGAQPA